MSASIKQAIFSFNGYNRDMWMAQMAATVPSGSDVLDAGAGTGIYRHLFSHCNYKSQDFCQESTTQGRYTKMDYVCDITNIPVPDESFDVILCTEVFEHLPEPVEAVKEFYRILRKGGKLFLTAPMACWLHQKPYIFYSGFTSYWYDKFLTANGFEKPNITRNRGFFGFYSQESGRFFKMVFPKERPFIKKILYFPLYLLLSLWLRKILPIWCYFLDKKVSDDSEDCTVGYFVEAQKKNL